MQTEPSIRTRLTLLVGGVALPLVFLAGYTIWTEFNSNLDEAKGQTDQFARSTAAAVQQYVHGVVEIAGQLVANPEVRALDPEQCLAALTPVVEALPHVTNLVVNRVNGPLVCSAVPLPDDLSQDNSDRPWVQAAIESGTYTIAAPAPGPISPFLLTSITVPIRGDEDEITGTLSVPLGIAHLQALVEIPLPEGALLTITDTTYTVIARSIDPEEWVSRKLPLDDPDERSDISLLTGYNTTESADGVRRLFGYTAIEGTPWIVWAGLPTSIIYGPTISGLYPKLGLAALTLMFVFVFARIINRQIQTSLSGLSEQMKAVEPSLDAVLTESGPSEIADVARQYNALLQGRRQAEAHAAASADLSVLVMRSTNDAFWDWDLGTNQIECNPRFFEMFGGVASQPEEAMVFWANRVHPEDIEQVRARIEEALASKTEHWTSAYRMRRADGEWAEISDRFYVVNDPDGAPVRLVGEIMDVTEARSAQRQIEKVKERYQSILQNAAFGIYVASMDGQILDTNPAFLKLLGADKATALTWTDRDFYVEPADRDRHVERSLTGGASHPIETQWQTPNGRRLYMRLFISSFVEASGDIAIEVIAEDLTERRRLDGQFRKAQRMEAMGQVAGGVAHDFNNRLTVIQGRGEMIRSEVEHDPDLTEGINAILESAARAAELTRGLLAVSRKQMYRPQVISLNELVDTLNPGLKTILGERFALEVSREDELPSVSADPGHLQQVLENLIVNARDAQTDGGTVFLKTSARSVSVDEASEVPGLRAGSYVALSITDQGPGIPPEVLNRVFEPFFTTKPMGIGTGMGLATAYGLAKQNDAFVSIDTELGRGTTVTLLVPEEGSDPIKVGAIGQTEVPRGDGSRVLVVEDEEGVRVVVVRTLQVLGYDVLETENADAALDLPDEALASLSALVTDVIMPGMQGPELADALRLRFPDLPTLFISGYQDQSGAFDFEPGSGLAFLAKPFTPQELGFALADLLRSLPVSSD